MRRRAGRLQAPDRLAIGVGRLDKALLAAQQIAELDLGAGPIRVLRRHRLQLGDRLVDTAEVSRFAATRSCADHA